MRPFRIVLGIAAMMLFCTGIIATYNQSGSFGFRVGPGWFQSVSMYGATALLLVSVVLSIAAVQFGTRRNEVARPRGLQLGQTTLFFGELSLVIGLVLPVLLFAGPVPLIVLTLSFKLPPILIAVGVVLVRSSAVALRLPVSHAPRGLSLGEATLRIGFVLLLLGWFLPKVLQALDSRLGFSGTLICLDSIPAGLVLLVLGAMIQTIEVRSWSIRAVLGLAAIISAGTVVFATQPPAARIGPGWLRMVAGSGEMVMLLVGVLVSSVSAQAGADRDKVAGPRGLHLGRNSLRVGAFLFGVGILLSVLLFLRLVPLALYYLCGKMQPILIAVGVVLLWSSIVALRRAGDHPTRVLTVGSAALMTGFVLLLLGCVSPLGFSGIPVLLRFFSPILQMDCILAGLALLLLGALIRAAERSQHGGAPEGSRDSQWSHESHVRIGSRPMASRPEGARADRLPPLDLGPRNNG